MGAGRELYELSWPEDLVRTIIYIPLHLVGWGALFGCFGLPARTPLSVPSYTAQSFASHHHKLPGLPGHYIAIKGSIQEEGITTLNTHPTQ